MRNKPVVGVVFGSRSTEHDVSVITALASIIGPLEASKKYQVLPIYIAKDGRWYCDEQLKDIALYTSGSLETWVKSHDPVMLSLQNGLSLVMAGKTHIGPGVPTRKLPSGGLGNRWQEVPVDVVFPATHGTHGEDGELMGILEMAGVPYVGCGVAASAVAMDKVLTKQVAQSSGIPVVPFVSFIKNEFETDPDHWITQVNRKLHYPLFIKPAHLGSSIGITRVTEPKDLRDAIEVALHYDDKALVEEGIKNLIEVTLPILGNLDGFEPLRPALLERPLTTGEEFFDFETKYMHGGKKTGMTAQGVSAGTGTKGAQGYSQLPAVLPDGLYTRAEATGLAVYRALGCSGTARVDMLIDTKTKIVYCNEVNPLPGSLCQHNWQRAGVAPVDLTAKLIDLAMERHARRGKLETVFAASFLKQF